MTIAESGLRPPYFEKAPKEVKRELNYEEAIKLLSFDGGSILMCGMAFTGEEGYPTRVVGILRLTEDKQNLEGWCYQHRPANPEQYDQEGFHRITPEDISKAKLPQAMFAVCAEVDRSLTEEKSRQTAIDAIK